MLAKNVTIPIMSIKANSARDLDAYLRTLDATPPRELPALGDAERAHSARLAQHIRAEIAHAGGAIDFARFMELALYAPGLGYYSAGTQKFGASGDFITAPELSPLFAQCLARACAPILQSLTRADVLEAGAGSGVLAAGLLENLQTLDALPARYFILELSADLRARQRALLQQRVPALLPRVQWLEQLPAQFRGVVLGNELLDAMPAARFIWGEHGAQRLQVGDDNGSFLWRAGAPDTALSAYLADLELPFAYISEVNEQAQAWLRTLGARMQAGALLLIDYGFSRAEFYHPQRALGTLMCHYRQRAHANPFVHVGVQDITAHIDFSAIADAGIDAGLDLLGYTSQAAFLLALGITEQVGAGDDTRAHLALTAQIKKLTLPSEMGELFKVIAFGRDLPLTLPGFTLHDRRGRL